MPIGHLVKTNPIQTQTNPIAERVEIDAKSVLTKDYRKNDDFIVRKNKAKTNPIAERAKIDTKCVFTKDYEEKCGYGLLKNKA